MMRHRVKTPEDLMPVLLDDAKPDQVIKIGAQLPNNIQLELTAFLREHKDVFAWTHADMPGIDPEIMVHRLNDDKRIPKRVNQGEHSVGRGIWPLEKKLINSSPLTSFERRNTSNGCQMW